MYIVGKNGVSMENSKLPEIISMNTVSNKTLHFLSSTTFDFSIFYVYSQNIYTFRLEKQTD